jgi:hypothetical protein
MLHRSLGKLRLAWLVVVLVVVLCSSQAWFEYGHLVFACEVALGLLKKVLDVALDLLLDELGPSIRKQAQCSSGTFLTKHR